MIRALIVDDEVKICKLIQLLGHWDEYNVEIIGEYYSGEEAMEIILEQKPDIVITDIKMPGMNGLDIIKEATDKGIVSNYIIISGYQEFSYAKEAIQLGAIAYLLKPINEADLNSALAEICAKINDKNVTKEQMRSMEDRINNQAQTLRNQVVYSFVVDYPGNKQIEYPCFSHPYFSLAIFHFSYKDKDMIRHNDVLMPQFINASMSYLEMNDLQAGLYSFENEMYCLMNYSQAGASEALAHSLSDFLRSKYYSFINVSCGISLESSSPRENMVNQAERANIYRWIYGENSILTFVELKHPHLEAPQHEVDTKDLHKAVEMMDEKVFSNFWDGFTMYCTRNERKPYDIYYNLIYIYNTFTNEVRKMNISDNIPGVDAFRAIILKNSKIRMALYECKQYILSLLREISESKNMADSYYIREAKAYISDHYKEQIVLEDIATRLKIHPTYFSEVFKRETGVSFKEYVTDLRIQTAKDCLIKSPTATVSEVSELSGYTNPQYFCRIFKKIIGITPTQFRKLHC